MKILFISCVILFGFLLNAHAQKDEKYSAPDMTRFSVGAEIGAATGTFADNCGLGLGFSGQVEHFFREHTSGIGYLGFISYFGKSISSTTKYKATDIIPIRIGARGYLGDAFHFGGQMGAGFISGGNGSHTAFAYTPEVGYNFRTLRGRLIDATLKYDGYSFTNGTIATWGIRVGYVF